ncbi:MAG TPA: Uma2 family endonuclease [Fimbriimonadaceae bacterium]|nr:Uma2 family endonuclease [Fimbriimonadaceae bacterium]
MGKFVRESVAAYGADLRLMTVDEYYRAADKGVFRSGEKLELIRGQVVSMSPQKSPHSWATGNVAETLREILPSHCVREQHPIRLDQFNEPEPGVAVAVGPCDRYRSRHPGPQDLLLIVEVADSSVHKDTKLKVALYAEFGIPEYWVLNLKTDCLEIYRDPVEDANGRWRYANVEVVRRDGYAGLLPAPEARISVSDLLP